MAEYMVDTDICIAVLKHNRPVIDKFIEHQGKVYVSSISCYELPFGMKKAALNIGQPRKVSCRSF